MCLEVAGNHPKRVSSPAPCYKFLGAADIHIWRSLAIYWKILKENYSNCALTGAKTNLYLLKSGSSPVFDKESFG